MPRKTAVINNKMSRIGTNKTTALQLVKDFLCSLVECNATVNPQQSLSKRNAWRHPMHVKTTALQLVVDAF